MSKRVIFDTSTLVSAALRIGSIPYQALVKGLATCDICASEETLAELERVLTFKKFDRFLDRTSRREFAAQIRRHAYLFVVKSEDLTAVLVAAISTTTSFLHSLWLLKLASW